MKLSKKTLWLILYTVGGVAGLWLFFVLIKKWLKSPPDETDEKWAMEYAYQIGLISQQAALESRALSDTELKEIDQLAKMIKDLGFKFFQEGNEFGVRLA